MTSGKARIRISDRPRTAAGLVICASLALAGCADDDDFGGPIYVPSELAVEIVQTEVAPDMPTLVWVEWRVQGAVGEVATRIEFGWDTDYGFEVEGERISYGTYRAQMMGVGAGSEVHFRPTAEDAEGSVEGEDHSLVLDDPPADLPTVTLVDPDPERSHSGFVTTTLVDEPPFPVILNARGEYVWWHEQDTAERSGVTRCLLSVDGETVLFIDYDTPMDGTESGKDGYIHRVGLDGIDHGSFLATGSHHDFTEIPDGTLAAVVGDNREVEGEEYPIFGDRIVEYEADGTEIGELWSAWDDFPYALLEYHAETWDWTHGNSIDYDADSESYYIGLRNPGAIVSVHRRSGTVLEVIGGVHSDFHTSEGSSEFFFHNHQYQLTEAGIVVFDNREDEPEGSRAVELSLDRDNGVAEVIWEHRPDPPQVSRSLGEVNRLPGGTTLITWSNLGLIEEVDEDNEVLWSVEVEPPAAFGYSRWYPSIDQP